ncbi:segregation and condensation protein A [Zongyangia hominis]|uniref:Segregation and condensation protein A n=1 Tax=Zongyangia hominis TaxID=2763677 RepID=A0A926IC35_9FIRM|nr:segregation/condensation protein A [Zongyangia hominis]MBC8570933.1 segregation/condensation protein A [Zongyangia hominis]
MEKLLFKLQEFEGPLDLLLHLIAKHKLNIYDIEISALLEQYLGAIEQMQRQDMEVASEFLEMAARLVHIKTVSLLPRHEEEQEELKRELSGQLLEYQAVKEIARELFLQNRSGDIFVRAPQPLPVDMLYTRSHPPVDLQKAYDAVLGKLGRKLPPPVTAFSGIVHRRVVSVSSRILFILRRLYEKSSLRFHSLFERGEDRSELVATFLGVLELAKSGRVRISDDNEQITLNTTHKRR